MNTTYSVLIALVINILSLNGYSQSGPWAKYDSKMKGEALVRESDGGYLEEVKSIVTGGGDINWQLQPSGLTPLMAAASNGRTDVVRFLLEKGADPNLKDVNGKTALDRAKAAGANDIVQLLNRNKNNTVIPTNVNAPAGPAKKEEKLINPGKPEINTNNKPLTTGSKIWPKLGTYNVGDSILFYAGSWKKGVIKEVGLPNDPHNKYAKPSENKYLIAPDAYANWPDWVNWSQVVKPQREPFWTEWFYGTWELGEVMAVNTRTEGSYEHNEYSYHTATDFLQINANGSYIWKPGGSKKIFGKWSPATDGPGIILHNAYRNIDWTIRNESSATTLNIRKLEMARLFPSSSSFMSISAKRPVQNQYP